VDYNEILENIIRLAKQVGDYQKSNMFNKGLSIGSKSTEIDLVTEVDKKSDEIIINYIQGQFPGHSILTEESGESGNGSDYLWIIDPLDGTVNFAQGLPIYAISIALQYKGETVLGVVYSPVIGDLFTAVKGMGAYRNGMKMEVSGKSSLISSVLATGFPYDIAKNPINNLDYFNAIAPKTRAVRRYGAAAYDLALVADGRFDGFWEMCLNIWDIAAAELMVKEAGGKVAHFRNDRNISIVAGNETMCGLILEELKKVDGHR
jgi:myo-inositol-1(or 4)-monophosphatase